MSQEVILAIIRVFGVPVLYIFFNILAEVFLAASYFGVKNQSNDIRITFENKKGQVEHLTTSCSNLIDIKSSYPDMTKITEVVNLPSLNWWDYPSVSFNLYFLSLSAGTLALFSDNNQQIIHLYRLVHPLHTLVLFLILFLGLITKRTNDQRKKKRYAGASFLISLITTIVTFAVLGEALS